MNRRTFVLRLAIAVAVVAPGCESERLARMAEQSTKEQSAQNQRVTQAHASLTEGSKQLVEADAQARRELVQLQDKVRDDQALVNEQRDALETERKAIVAERRSDSICSSSLVTFGILLACLAPLILAGIALATSSRGPSQQEVGEVLVQELVQALGEDANQECRVDRLASAASPRLPPPTDER